MISVMAQSSELAGEAGHTLEDMVVDRADGLTLVGEKQPALVEQPARSLMTAASQHRIHPQAKCRIALGPVGTEVDQDPAPIMVRPW